jgi:uncharacterized protein
LERGEDMLKIGDYNKLIVSKEVDFGIYLESDLGEILMPKRYVPEGTKVGDEIEAFIYKDSEDRLIATTLKPKAKVGEFAFLKVKDVNKTGAFMDWGLDKDLLVPFGEQKMKMEIGRWYVVRLYFDDVTSRVTASSRFNRFFEKENIDLEEGQEVDLLVFRHDEKGADVIINNKYVGLVYENDIYEEIRVGLKLKGYILKVREDGKIDVTLRKRGFREAIDTEREKILLRLREEGGFLALTDKSPAPEIESELHMSKKAFKRAVGTLYKEKVIEITEKGIKFV